MRKYLYILFIAVFFIACGDDDKAIKVSYKVGDSINLSSYDGKTISLVREKNGFSLKNDKSKIIIFDFFGTFCPPCKEEAPYLSALQKELKDEVVIIALAYFEKKDNSKLELFAKMHKADYFITNDNNGDAIIDMILDDIGYQGVIQLPFKVMVKDGEYQVFQNQIGIKSESYFYLGKLNMVNFKKQLQQLLSKNSN